MDIFPSECTVLFHLTLCVYCTLVHGYVYTVRTGIKIIIISYHMLSHSLSTNISVWTTPQQDREIKAAETPNTRPCVECLRNDTGLANCTALPCLHIVSPMDCCIYTSCPTMLYIHLVLYIPCTVL